MLNYSALVVCSLETLDEMVTMGIHISTSIILETHADVKDSHIDHRGHMLVRLLL